MKPREGVTAETLQEIAAGALFQTAARAIYPLSCWFLEEAARQEFEKGKPTADVKDMIVGHSVCFVHFVPFC